MSKQALREIISQLENTAAHARNKTWKKSGIAAIIDQNVQLLRRFVLHAKELPNPADVPLGPWADKDERFSFAEVQAAYQNGYARGWCDYRIALREGKLQAPAEPEAEIKEDVISMNRAWAAALGIKNKDVNVFL